MRFTRLSVADALGLRKAAWPCYARRVRSAVAARLLFSLALTLVALGAGPLRAQNPVLPIFDTHIHYSAPDWAEYPPDRILGILGQAGIKRALVSSTPDDGTLTLYAKDPKRVVPILRPYRTRDDIGHWWQDPAVLAYVQDRLAKNPGVHKGIGEFHLFGGQTGTFVVKRIAELAVQQNIYLHAHSDELAIIELFTLEPRLKIIWAHAGMTSGPQAVGALLDRYPTLWVDLAVRNNDVAPGGTLDPGWRAVFLRHPDRFLAGTDTWITSRWEALPGSVTEVRGYLSQLPRDVAEKIAFRNAERLFP
ncbi:MAG TPA: amidohydrolase family protein [Methylomirabilota bacterium]|nr:amidohydrolase family protein [Methylomirabilota bacterium]